MSCCVITITKCSENMPVKLLRGVSHVNKLLLICSMTPSLFRRRLNLHHSYSAHTVQLKTGKQSTSISASASVFESSTFQQGLPTCLVCYVLALPNESACQSLQEPHHPHHAPLPRCPPASSVLAKSCSPAAKTGLLTKASQWSLLVRDLIASGLNATEAAPTRTAATSFLNNESVNEVRVVC